MQRSEEMKQQYLKRVSDQLAKQRFSHDDAAAIVMGLDEHIDEEIRVRRINGEHTDHHVMGEVLNQLELPDSIEADSVTVTGVEQTDNPVTRYLPVVSIGLSILSIPVFVVGGYYDTDRAFDLFFVMVVSAVLLGSVSFRSRWGKNALLVSALPLVLLTGIILFALLQ